MKRVADSRLCFAGSDFFIGVILFLFLAGCDHASNAPVQIQPVDDPKVVDSPRKEDAPLDMKNENVPEFTGKLNKKTQHVGGELAIGSNETSIAATLLNEANVFPSHRFGPIHLRYIDSGKYGSGEEWMIFEMRDPRGPSPSPQSMSEPFRTSPTMIRLEYSRKSNGSEWELRKVAEEYSVKTYIWIQRSAPLYH